MVDGMIEEIDVIEMQCEKAAELVIHLPSSVGRCGQSSFFRGMIHHFIRVEKSSFMWG
jgi:hypothetical protein